MTRSDLLPLHVHLLVVDDDDVDRGRVLRLLGRTTLNFEAKQAATSTDALTLLREHEFDCVMLDNQLGDASGAALLPAIQRESRRACPVIMITGAGSETLAVQALQQGAADYLTKFGLNPDTLARAIRRALDHHRLQLELEELHLRLEERVAQQAAAIRQTERDLRAILDHTPTAIGYWDAQLRNRFGNRAHRRWADIEPERLPGRHLADVIGARRLSRLQPHLDSVLRGETQYFELATEAAGEAPARHEQYSLHPDTSDDGRVRGFYSSVHDVTPIRLAQARAEELAAFNETLFEHSPVGLGVCDERGGLVRANQALAELLGGKPADLLAQTLDRLLHGDVLPLMASARATLADGLPRRVEIDLQTVFGRRLQAACAWARVEREGRAHALLAAQDTTEQRQAHDALVAARDAAEQATRSKSAFLANMSHEIRTPMNAIVGLSHLALEDELPPEARQFVAKAHHAAQALMGILDDVLDYSKVEAGQLHIEHLPLDIEQVVQRSIDLFSVRLAQKGLRFVVELSDDLPACVLGDPLRLSQVLNNLLGNAAKFTDQGQVRLTVQRLPGASPAPDMYRFSVRDSGIGIDPAHRSALFEAFSQADGSITRRFGGTGLGLTICRRLVSLMHGSIGFESQPGEGSEFWFTAHLDRPPLPVPAPAAPMLAGLGVLVADPDARQAQQLLQRVQGWGARAWTAGGAAELPVLLARLAAAGEAVDVVLVDEAWLPALPALQADHAGQAGQPEPAELAAGPALGADAVADVAGMAGPTGAPVPVRRGPAMPVAVLAMVSVVSRRHPEAAAVSSTAGQLRKPVLPAALRTALAQVGSPAAGRTGAAAPSPFRGSPAPRPLAGLCLLVVEDNETNRLVAQVFLERQGASVRVAGDGEAALAMLQADPLAVDAVLMDLHMPVMDGLTATRRIHALSGLGSMPVIGMTAAAMPEDRARCLAAGMVDHLTKPIVVEQVLAVLLHWTGRQRRPEGAVPDLAVPGFDLAALRELLHGDRGLMVKMLTMFAQQEADAAQAVARLVARDDVDAACRRLHKLRGAAGTLGALDLAQAALALERALRQHQPVQAPLAAFGAAMARTLGALAAVLSPPA